MSDSSILADQLRDKALLALEDAVQETRYRTPRPSFAVRFALAYLWVYGGRRDRKVYDDFWRELRAEKSPWSHGCADGALGWIYRSLGVERPERISWEMWERWHAHEGHGGQHGDR